MTFFFLILDLSVLALSVSVTDKDTCNQCVELMSQNDCESQTKSLGCEWKNNLCQQKTTTNETILGYCQTITDPAVNCAKTFGCAFENEKCTHFSGCTAYMKTTSSECQLISTSCTTNGITCDDIKNCQEYTTERTCQITPVSPYKCKWENDTCRDYKCTEADISISTDSDCNTWLKGCLTTGMGCTDARKQCAEYTGTQDICNKMIGQDGKCTSDKSNDKQCKVRACYEAVLTTWDQTTCNNYQYGCKSTGFSCVDSYVSCTSYTGTSTTCLNFIGSEGQCAFDSTTTKCKGRKCEDKLSGKLSDCTTYLSGCITNGVSCVTVLGNCNLYKGTTVTCLNYIGADGNCKGTDATNAQASCSLKTCADDDLGTETTDTACQLVQSNCKTTGKGCVSTLQSCTTYTDDGNCLNYIGSDGKCKAGSGGDSPKCAVRVCTDNTTSTSNTDCQTYKPGCVTNGAGCIQEASCSDTVNMLACQGTTNNYTCGWTSSCVAKDCTAFSQNQSLCENTKLSDSQPCIWETTSTACQNAECGDYIETDDYSCDSHMQGCITNGVKCAAPDNCDEFQGNMTMCRGFIKAYCTNTDDSILATTACIARTCDDKNITATLDSDCSSYLPGCLYAGTNKCISDLSECTQYSGTSIEEIYWIFKFPLNQCSNYENQISCVIGSNKTICGWLPEQKCAEFTKCSDAKGTTLSDCTLWNNSCISDGSACVDIDECQLYVKETACQNDKDKNSCFWVNAKCRLKLCSDYKSSSDAECIMNIAQEGTCTTDGTNCVLRATCSSYSKENQCTIGSNSIPCFFDSVSKSCREKECTDILGISNDKCKGMINKKECVSNGKNCVAQSTCVPYKNKVSCAGGGTDNSICVFRAIPTSTDPFDGTCQPFISCQSANGDATTCALNQSCKYIQATKLCQTTDCTTFNPSGKCNPIPDFDGKVYTICVNTGKVCEVGDPLALVQVDCYSNVSRYTHTWNSATMKCQSCKVEVTNNYESPNLTIETEVTNRGFIMSILIVLYMLIA